MCVSGPGKFKRGKPADSEEDLTDSSTSISTESLAYVQSILSNVKHERKRAVQEGETVSAANLYDDSKGLLMNLSDECNIMSTWSESIEEPVTNFKDESECLTDRTHFSTPISFASLEEIDSDLSFTDIAISNRFSFVDDSRDMITELESEVDSTTMVMTSAVEYMMSMKQLTKNSDGSLANIEFSSFDNVADYLSSME
jgi:hypothetical protein